MTEKHLTDHWPVAPGHELTQADWDAIKAAADEWAGRSDDGQWSVQIPAYVDITYLGAGGRKDSGATRQQLWVIHTAECPLQTGYAASLSRWGADSTVQASWHRMSDPATVARFVPVGRAAWHATWANWISIGYEQAGYAAFPRSTWLTDDGMASIDRLAQVIVADGIPADAVRVLTDAEVAAVKAGNTSIRGLCSHAQIQPADRTDPGAGYPWDVLLERIRHHHPDITTDTGDDDMGAWDATFGTEADGTPETAGERLGRAAAAYAVLTEPAQLERLANRIITGPSGMAGGKSLSAYVEDTARDVDDMAERLAMMESSIKVMEGALSQILAAVTKEVGQ